jgi:tetratricopeptide (TPR) repeat protein
MHCYDEARAIFGGLREETQNVDRLGNVISEALCLINMGQEKNANTLIEQYQSLASGRSMFEPHQLHYWSIKMQLLASTGQIAEAREIARRVINVAKQLRDPVVVAAVIPILLNTAENEMPTQEREEMLRELIAVCRSALTSFKGADGVTSTALGFTEVLYKALCALGQTTQAITLLEEMGALISPYSTPRSWLIWTWLYELQRDNQNDEEAAKALVLSLASLAISLDQVASISDVKTLLTPYTKQVRGLIKDAIFLSSEGPKEHDWLGTLAADLPAAPILSARLRASVKLAIPWLETASEENRISALLHETPAHLVQVAQTGTGIAVLSMSLDNHQNISRTSQLIELDWASVAATIRRLIFRLRNISANASQLDSELGSVKGWPELKSFLASILQQFDPSLPICISPGPIPTAAYTLAAGAGQSVCFVPSVAALIALRARRRASEDGVNWRPRSMFDVAVWRFGDRPNVIDALRSAIDVGATLAQQHGLRYSGCIGENADAKALKHGFANADLARIACHGRLLEEEEAIDLLVASEGLLPPADCVALASHLSKGHVLSWRDLESCEKVPRIVISSACDSGGVIHHQGGERLGLERPLLAAGTICFIAPQWPVPAGPIQSISSTLVETYLSNSNLSLAETLQTTKRQAQIEAFPALASQAFAIFGDGL